MIDYQWVVDVPFPFVSGKLLSTNKNQGLWTRWGKSCISLGNGNLKIPVREGSILKWSLQIGLRCKTGWKETLITDIRTPASANSWLPDSCQKLKPVSDTWWMESQGPPASTLNRYDLKFTLSTLINIILGSISRISHLFSDFGVELPFLGPDSIHPHGRHGLCPGSKSCGKNDR